MGLEFNNEEYRKMGEKLNTKVKSSAEESPWPNAFIKAESSEKLRIALRKTVRRLETTSL